MVRYTIGVKRYDGHIVLSGDKIRILFHIISQGSGMLLLRGFEGCKNAWCTQASRAIFICH